MPISEEAAVRLRANRALVSGGVGLAGSDIVAELVEQCTKTR